MRASLPAISDIEVRTGAFPWLSSMTSTPDGGHLALEQRAEVLGTRRRQPPERHDGLSGHQRLILCGLGGVYPDHQLASPEHLAAAVHGGRACALEVGIEEPRLHARILLNPDPGARLGQRLDPRRGQRHTVLAPADLLRDADVHWRVSRTEF